MLARRRLSLALARAPAPAALVAQRRASTQALPPQSLVAAPRWASCRRGPRKPGAPRRCLAREA
eukprot:5854268-Alexandrium_andersonii.AAC.1